MEECPRFLPAGRSILGNTVPQFLSTALGLCRTWINLRLTARFFVDAIVRLGLDPLSVETEAYHVYEVYASG